MIEIEPDFVLEGNRDYRLDRVAGVGKIGEHPVKRLARDGDLFIVPRNPDQIDLMMLAGNDVRAAPLIERRTMLADLLAEAPPAIRYQEYLEGDGEEIIGQVCDLRLEGIISKLKESRYVSGSSAWQKRKCLNYTRMTASR